MIEMHLILHPWFFYIHISISIETFFFAFKTARLIVDCCCCCISQYGTRRHLNNACRSPGQQTKPPPPRAHTHAHTLSYSLSLPPSLSLNLSRSIYFSPSLSPSLPISVTKTCSPTNTSSRHWDPSVWGWLEKFKIKCLFDLTWSHHYIFNALFSYFIVN